MESFIVKEVQKRPIIYDKTFRTIENYKELVKLAFQDISREIEDTMQVQVPYTTIEIIWNKCLLNFRANKDPTSGSSKTVPHYFMDMVFMKSHLSHREPSTSDMPVKAQKSISKNKSNKITKTSRKMPKLDHFAEKKLEQDQQLVKAIDNIQQIIQTQTEKTANSTANNNSIDSDYFNLIYDKLARMAAPDVDQSFIKVLEILDKFQKLE